MKRISNEQREAIVRKAVAERDALLAQVQDCPTCANLDSPGAKGPCKTCIRLWKEENGGREDNWTPRPSGVDLPDGSKPK